MSIDVDCAVVKCMQHTKACPNTALTYEVKVGSIFCYATTRQFIILVTELTVINFSRKIAIVI
jgi:hypothetical protein